MVDKNGEEIKIGDKLKPDNGAVLLIVSRINIPELGECLFGQQIENPLAFSPLTQENLSSQWEILKEEIQELKGEK